MHKTHLFILLFFAILIMSSCGYFEYPRAYEFREPLMITSAGQSPGALQLTVIANMMELDYTFDKLLNSDYLNSSSYNTLIFVVGVSAKGLGAANISLDDEIKRVRRLAIEAKSAGKSVIVCNIEGASRRGPSSDLVVNTLSPYSDAYFVRSDANQDGFFTNLSEKYKVPLELFEKNIDIRDILIKFFGDAGYLMNLLAPNLIARH